MKELKKYQALQKAADRYYDKWKYIIDKQVRRLKTKRISKELPLILKRGHMVWCRDGFVSRIATPCIDLECEHKIHMADVSDGCSKCQRFQITSYSDNWAAAKHIFESSDVIENFTTY